MISASAQQVRPDAPALRLPARRAALAARLGGARLLPRGGRAVRRPAEILRAGNVPVPEWKNPHGARAQLHARRRGGALQARARVFRAAPDGLGRVRPAGGERGARARHPPGERGPPTTSPPCAPSCSAWACRSTGAREFATCDPEYYGQQQKLFLDLLRAGLVERRESWVNWDPVDQHGAGERAGDRRPRLALRRAGREEVSSRSGS